MRQVDAGLRRRELKRSLHRVGGCIGAAALPQRGAVLESYARIVGSQPSCVCQLRLGARLVSSVPERA